MEKLQFQANRVDWTHRSIHLKWTEKKRVRHQQQQHMAKINGTKKSEHGNEITTKWKKWNSNRQKDSTGKKMHTNEKNGWAYVV